MNYKKLILLLFFCFFSKGCSPKSIDYNVNVIKKIPNYWITKTKIQDDNSVDWWMMFNDSLLNNYYLQFINENPDFQSIVDQLDISNQFSNIKGSIIYPSLSISNNANYSERNLTSFGFSDAILGDDQENSNNDNGVFTFESGSYG